MNKSVIAPEIRSSKRYDGMKNKLESTLKPYIILALKNENPGKNSPASYMQTIENYVWEIIENIHENDYLDLEISKARISRQEKNISIEKSKSIKEKISKNKSKMAENADKNIMKKVDVYNEAHEFLSKVKNDEIIIEDEEVAAYLKDESIDIYVIVRLIYNTIKEHVIKEMEKQIG